MRTNTRKASEPDLVTTALRQAQTFRQQGQLNPCLNVLLKAQAQAPDDIRVELALGDAYQGSHQFEAALHHYNQALQINRTCSRALQQIGSICLRHGHYQRAIDFYSALVATDPNNKHFAFSLATAHDANGNLDAALSCALHAKQNAPNDAFTTLLAESRLHSACQFDQTNPNAFKQAANTLLNEISAENQEALAFFPLESLHCDSTNDEHLSYKHTTEAIAQQLRLRAGRKTQPAPSLRSGIHKESPIRLGFVSGDLKTHVVSRFLLPLFKNIDQSQAHLYCYSTSGEYDNTSEELEQYCKAFRRISKQTTSLSAAKEIIHRDNIDILFDLSGHTKDNRLELFTQKLAPIQASWLGYPGSTGLEDIDFLLLDQHLEGQNTKHYCTEQLIAKPGPFLCLDSWLEHPIQPDTPQDRKGTVTLGITNHPRKYNPESIALWATILRNHPNTKLLIGRSEMSSKSTRENTLKSFERHGINSDQIEIVDHANPWLDVYNQIDICLDSFPYTGTTTTIDALWMGVPVVTLCGSAIHQRASAAILKHCNCSNWVATSEEEYARITNDLILDPHGRRAARSQLRDQLMQSSLADAEQFAKDFIQTAHEMIQIKTKAHQNRQP